jgi:hypothetical protein
MVSLNCCDADWPLLSVTRIVNLKVPAEVGVPASWFLLSAGAPVDVSARPGGSSPRATALSLGRSGSARRGCDGCMSGPSDRWRTRMDGQAGAWAVAHLELVVNVHSPDDSHHAMLVNDVG